MLVLCFIQSALNSPARKFVLGWIVGIVDRNCVLVVKTSFTGIALFLLDVFNSIPRAKCFKLTSQLPIGYLNKVLIIRLPNINLLFDTWVIANYQLAYFVFNTVIDYQSRALVQIVSNTITTPLIKSSLLVCKRFNSLLIFRGRISVPVVVKRHSAFGAQRTCPHVALEERARRICAVARSAALKLSIAFVVPLINAFKSFPINQKLMPISIDTGAQIINSQIQSNSLIRIDRCFYFLVFINIFNLKPSSRVFWSGRIRVPVVVRRRSALRAASYLLDFLAFKSFWKLNLDFTVFLFKLARHRNVKHSVFEPNSRNNQREISLFREVVRQFRSLFAATDRYCFKQPQKRSHAPI